MIKARHHILRLSPADMTLLKEYQRESARCWNFIVRTANDHYRSGGGWISKKDLQTLTKGRFKLHSQTIQALTDKYVENRQTAASLRKGGDTKTRYPWREKEFLTIPFKQMALRRSDRGSLVLTLSAGVRFDTGFIPPLSVNTAEILWRKGRYVLSWTAEYPETETLAGIRAGVDIGEIHPVALCSETGNGLVVSGREIRSIKQQRNKSLGWFSRALSRCTKGSRRWKKLLRARGRLKSKTDDQVRNAIHQATRKAINWCVEHGVSELVIGNPAGVEKNTKKDRRLSRKARQKVSQMETGRIKQYLRHKATEAGVASCLTNERGTSKGCPACGKMNHPRGRVYSCSCGFTAHRDGKAGFMMIRKKHPDTPTPSEFQIGHKQAIPTYRKRPRPACVDAPDVGPRSLAIAGPLHGKHLAL